MLTINCDDNGNTGSGGVLQCVPEAMALALPAVPPLYANSFE